MVFAMKLPRSLAVLGVAGLLALLPACRRGGAARPEDENRTPEVKQAANNDVKPADTEPKSAPPRVVDAATIAAYAKLGGHYGGMLKTPGTAGHISFIMGEKAAQEGGPAFRFEDNPPSKLPEVPLPFALDFAATLTDAGMKHVGGLKNVTSLYLGGTQITDAGLKELAGMDNLTTLKLSGTRVTDAGMKEVAGLKNLVTLDLSSTKVSAAGLRELAGLKKLSLLSLEYMPLTLDVLRTLREIGLLHVQGRCAGKDGARPTGPGDVYRLNLSNYGVTADALREFADFANLGDLYLGGTYCTDDVLTQVARFKKLTKLNLDLAKITDAGLKELAPLEDLTSLTVTLTAVTDAGLKEIAVHKNLQYLSVVGTKATDTGVRELRKALPKCKIIFR